MIKLSKAAAGCLLALTALLNSQNADAQRIAVKTNTLDWIALSPNLGLEARLSRRLSFQLAVAGNPFNISVADTNWKNYRIEPELRYWFNRPMARHFLALSATAAGFHLRHADRHLQGDAVGAGISYGYALVLGDHWNMEAEVGVGLAHFSAYDYYGDNGRHELASKNFKKFMPVPIRLGLSFSYIFK
ncbi:MAG: DUF3575 domain-containing protein [Muribaculaceae bacterium]|nr:DUF3575 domain-containing protein [Muribaculaceae bacterium]